MARLGIETQADGNAVLDRTSLRLAHLFNHLVGDRD
jgi:hypothetical protein